MRAIAFFFNHKEYNTEVKRDVNITYQAISWYNYFVCSYVFPITLTHGDNYTHRPVFIVT